MIQITKIIEIRIKTDGIPPSRKIIGKSDAICTGTQDVINTLVIPESPDEKPIEGFSKFNDCNFIFYSQKYKGEHLFYIDTKRMEIGVMAMNNREVLFLQSVFPDLFFSVKCIPNISNMWIYNNGREYKFPSVHSIVINNDTKNCMSLVQKHLECVKNWNRKS